MGVPASFWINLQAIYDSEKLEVEKETTITEEEIQAFHQIKEVIKYLRNIGKMPLREKMKDAILSARRALQISNLSSLNTLTAVGSFRMSTNVSVNYFVMGAWLRICQKSAKVLVASQVYNFIRAYVAVHYNHVRFHKVFVLTNIIFELCANVVKSYNRFCCILHQAVQFSTDATFPVDVVWKQTYCYVHDRSRFNIFLRQQFFCLSKLTPVRSLRDFFVAI